MLRLQAPQQQAPQQQAPQLEFPQLQVLQLVALLPLELVPLQLGLPPRLEQVILQQLLLLELLHRLKLQPQRQLLVIIKLPMTILSIMFHHLLKLEEDQLD